MPIDHRTLITQGTRLARTAGRLYLLVVAVGAVVQVAAHAGIRVPAPVGTAQPGLPTIVHDVLAPHPVADLWLVAYLVTKGVPARRPDRLVPAGVTA